MYKCTSVSVYNSYINLINKRSCAIIIIWLPTKTNLNILYNKTNLTYKLKITMI